MITDSHLRYSTRKDEPALKRLLCNAFGDNGTFADLFIARFHRRNALVYDDGKIVSMAFLLPAKMQIGNELHNLTYLYACATVDEYRHRGIMSMIINRARNDVFARNHIAVFLFPATDSLYNYYENLSFAPFFYYDDQTCYSTDYLSAANQQSYDIVNILPEHYAKVRYDFMNTPNAIIWDNNVFEFIAEDGPKSFFFIIKNKCGQTVGAGYAHKNNDSMEIEELLGNDIHLASLATCFFKNYDLVKVHVKTPGTTQKYGLISFRSDYNYLLKQKGYFCFAMD